MTESSATIPPAMMLRSFLTIGSGFVLHLTCLMAAVYLIGQAFPEFREFQQLDSSSQQEIMATEPYRAIPPLMFWSVVAVVSLFSFGIGVMAVRTAPFSPFVHAAFLAVILFVTYLQGSISEPPPKKSLTLVYMLAFPISTLVGGQLASRRAARLADESKP